MARMGHDSMAAALIYRYPSREGDELIAAQLELQMAATSQVDGDVKTLAEDQSEGVPGPVHGT